MSFAPTPRRFANPPRKRAANKRDRAAGTVSLSSIVSAHKALMTKLDGNPEVRKMVLDRIVKAAAKAPVALLHQMAQTLEMIDEEI